MSKPTRISVAVLGSGLAGLVTAYLLALQVDPSTGDTLFDVHIIERGASIGLCSATLVLPDGRRIETPMRAAQGGYYDRLLRLYDFLGIQRRIVDFDYSISRGSEPIFQYEGANGLRLDPVSKPAGQNWTDFACLIAVITLSYLYVGLWATWYWLTGAYDDLRHDVHRTTLRDWCRQRFVPELFCDTILLPLFAAVCTVPMNVVEQTPAADTLEYIIKTFGARHYLADMQTVVDALLKPIDKANIRFSFDVSHIVPLEGGLVLQSSGGSSLKVDHVVSCTPSPVAARLSRSLAKSLEASGQPSAAESARANLLSRFGTRQATVVNHSDEQGAQLPLDERDRRILNLSLPTNAEKHVSATHIISKGLLQTTNPRNEVDASKVLSSATFERAVVSLDSRRAQAELWTSEMQGLNRLWLAGSWAASGIPLLEQCVVSAERVVKRLCETQLIEYRVPW